jgi:hypothetical protein
MRNKEIRFKVTRIIMKLTGREFKNANKLARIFLRSDCYIESTELSNLGFAYDWEWTGENEELTFRGLHDKEFEKTIPIPSELFQLLEKYEENRRKKTVF